LKVVPVSGKRKRDGEIADNAQLLNTFWQRMPFHDMAIENIERVAGRVNVTLDEYVLCLVNTTKYKAKLPENHDVWLYCVLDGADGKYELSVETESGSFLVNFGDLRLIRRTDYAVLIPAIDH